VSLASSAGKIVNFCICSLKINLNTKNIQEKTSRKPHNVWLDNLTILT
jgi:hypothetical protein